ncbi:hypothetical protein MP228_009921 [Amoeboaphelidium protococcarum]|nr:hypothetical protein MP228_009921 [Amoeboaphelidium protococcarum]
MGLLSTKFDSTAVVYLELAIQILLDIPTSKQLLLINCFIHSTESGTNVPHRVAFLVRDRSVRKTGPSFDHSVQDRAQTKPLVLDRRQTGLDLSKRYISVAIVTMAQRVNNDYKIPQLRVIQY